MMNHVVDFFGYMFFSSLEYLMIFLFIFSFFRLHPEHYRKEIVALTLVTTFISYLLVLAGIFEYVPLPIILIPVVVYLLKRLTQSKLLFSTFISIVGFAFYLLLQASIAKLLILFNVISPVQVTDPFGAKTFLAQSICIAITFSIIISIRVANGGFFFKFSNPKHNKKIISYVAIGLLLFLSINYIAFISNETSSAILILLSASILSFIVFIYLSYKSELIEHT